MKFFTITLAILYALLCNQLEAQTLTCAGQVCSSIPAPLLNQLNQSASNFQTQYMKPVLTSITESGFMANIASSGVGMGKVRNFNLGVSLSAGGSKKEDIQVRDNVVTFPKLPNVGASVAPNVQLDFNLGSILFMDNTYLNRFHIFLHGMKYTVTEGDLKAALREDSSYTIRGNFRGYGGNIRYEAIQEHFFFMGLVSWKGINIGGGVHFSNQDFDLTYREANAPRITFGGLNGRWGGDTKLDYRTKVQTTHVDVRTGIGLFYFLTIFAGGGVSWNRGDSNLSLSRTGPFVVSIGGLQDLNIPREYASLFQGQPGAISQSGTLTLRTSESGRSNRTIGYFVGGLELDFFYAKILLEGVYASKELAGASLGVKVTF